MNNPKVPRKLINLLCVYSFSIDMNVDIFEFS